MVAMMIWILRFNYLFAYLNLGICRKAYDVTENADEGTKLEIFGCLRILGLFLLLTSSLDENSLLF